MAQIRSTDRILRSQTTAAELEPLAYDSEEDDDLDGLRAGHVGQYAGLHSAAGPVRTMKSRVKGESTFERREQNRIAQRAFRKRQKAYFINLEKDVVDMSERLQGENNALKAANAPKFAGIPVASDMDTKDVISAMNIDTHGLIVSPVDREASGSGTGRGTDTEDVLISFKELADPRRIAHDYDTDPSHRGSSASVGSSSAYSSATLISPVTTTYGSTSTRMRMDASSAVLQKRASTKSGGSISQVSLLATPAPRGQSFSHGWPSNKADTKPVSLDPMRNPEEIKIIEVINNPICRMGEYLPPTMLDSAAHSYDHVLWGMAEAISTSPTSAYKFDSGVSARMQQHVYQRQCHEPELVPNQTAPGILEDRQRSVIQHPQIPLPEMDGERERKTVDQATLARQYSKALQRHHARPLLRQGSDFRGPISFAHGDRHHTAKRAHDIAYEQSILISTSGPPCSNDWANNPVCGQQFPEYVRTSHAENGGAGTARVNHNKGLQAPVYQFTASQYAPCAQSASLEVQPLQEEPSGQSVAQACMFAGMIPGLKAESNGTNMPFASVLTPIDGLGLVDNPFATVPSGTVSGGDGHRGVWRDLDYFRPMTFGAEHHLHRHTENSEIIPSYPDAYCGDPFFA